MGFMELKQWDSLSKWHNHYKPCNPRNPRQKKWRNNMANIKESPYVCHIFICTNDRQGKRKSCADGDSLRVRTLLKKEISDRGLKKQVRVFPKRMHGALRKRPQRDDLSPENLVLRSIPGRCGTDPVQGRRNSAGPYGLAQ